MQHGTRQQEQCTTMGAVYPWVKGISSKRSGRPIKRKYKADLKRRWQKDVELELLDRENWVSQDAQ